MLRKLLALGLLFSVCMALPISARQAKGQGMTLDDLQSHWLRTYDMDPEDWIAALSRDLLAKAEPDECFLMPGYPLPGPPCSEGVPKVNQAYVWAMVQTGDTIYFGTVANTLCMVLGGFFGMDAAIGTDSWVCEFGDSQYSPPLPDEAGDWRSPRMYRYHTTSESLEEITPIDPLVLDTFGVRSAGTIGDVVYLAGPSLTNGINLFAFQVSTGAYLGSTNLSMFNDIRRWLQVDGQLYTAVGSPGGGGVILRMLVDPVALTDLFAYEMVGFLDGNGAELALHDGRLFAGTWPNSPGAPVPAGIFMSPEIPPGGLNTSHQMIWDKVWSVLDYEPEPTVAFTQGVGAMCSYDGYLYWGTMHVPLLSTLFFFDIYGEPDTPEEFLLAFLGTSRSTSLFRGSGFGNGTDIDLLYGLPVLPVYDPIEETWSLESNNMGESPRFGLSGFFNFFNNYTWSMTVYQDQLLVGTMDFSYLLWDIVKEFVHQHFGEMPRCDIHFPESFLGADLWRFPCSEAPALPESLAGGGNYANYGFRNLISDDTYVYAGMGNPMNLMTDPEDDLPEGGWELLRLWLEHDLRVTPGENQVICEGNSVRIGGTPTAREGVEPYFYHWESDPPGFCSCEANPMVSPTEDTLYTVRVWDWWHICEGKTGSTMVYVVDTLDAPSLLAPGDGSELPGLEADLSWDDHSDEVAFRLTLSDSAGHVWTWDLPQGAESFFFDASMGILSRGLDYSWYVTALGDGSLCDSPPSDTWNFSIASLPEPMHYTLIYAADQVSKDNIHTRTNLGLMSLSSGYLEAELTLRNSYGHALETISLPVGYNQFAAYSDLMSYFPAGYYAGTIDITTPDAIYFVGGLVDNLTQDPSIYPQDIEQGEALFTPIIIRNNEWTTQVVLRNLSDQDLQVQLTAYEPQQLASGKNNINLPARLTSETTIAISANGYFVSDDIMAFLADPQPFALLCAQVVGGSGDITGFARQVCQSQVGGVYPFYQADGGATQLVFPYICDLPERRSNLGLANMNDTPLDITAAFYRDGQLDAGKTYTVQSRSYYSIAHVIRDVRDAAGLQNTSGYLVLTAALPFRAVGGPIDNLSGDPSVFGGYQGPLTSGFTPLVLRSSPWRTDLVLTNNTDNPANVALTLYQFGAVYGTLMAGIPARSNLRMQDVVLSFGADDLYGSLFIQPDTGIYAFVEQTTGPGGASGVYPVYPLDSPPCP